MIMTAPAGGDTFTSRTSARSYTAANNTVQVAIDDGDMKHALSRGWHPVPPQLLPPSQPGAGREATVIIAPAGSTAAADYRCTGVNDDVVINLAIADLPAGGGKVKLRAGVYKTSASIVIDRSYVDLEGENHPMWGAFNGSWTGTGSPTGAIGANCATIQAQSGIAANAIISIRATNIPDNGESRHRGIRVANLYLVGNAYANNGIECFNPCDSPKFEGLFIHRVVQGMSLQADSPWIINNNIQDFASVGIVVNGSCVNAKIRGNLLFDSGGVGIYAYGAGHVISGNTIGDMTGDSIQLQGTSIGTGGMVVSGNNILAGAASAINVVADSAGSCISGNVINYAAGNNFAGKARSVGAIKLAASVTGCAIVGNTLIGNSALSGSHEPAGVYAIDGTTSSNNLIVGNNTFGSAANSWNGGGASINNGTGNTVANNL